MAPPSFPAEADQAALDRLPTQAAKLNTASKQVIGRFFCRHRRMLRFCPR